MLFSKQSTHKDDYKSSGKPECSRSLFPVSSSWYSCPQHDSAKHLRCTGLAVPSPPSLHCVAHVRGWGGGGRSLNREFPPSSAPSIQTCQGHTQERVTKAWILTESPPLSLYNLQVGEGCSRLRPSLASSTCRRRCGPRDSRRGMSEEAPSLFWLLAAIRRENHLWHSGDSFVTLTVMLLCAGLTHRMNP